jgi:hypothetical protein
MNLQSYINVARKQFYELDKQASRRVLEKYGWEELELTGEELSSFVKNATSHKLDEPLINRLNRFFSWYYLNYADIDNWDVKIYHPPVKEIYNVCMHPVNKYEEDGEICFKKCERETANLWSVYIQTNEGEYCVADCKSQLIATRLEEMFLMMIKNWKVKILLDAHNITIRIILSSHTLEVLLINRSVIDKEPATSKFFQNATTIQENSRIGEFYQSIPVATENDLLIRNLVKSAGF